MYGGKGADGLSVITGEGNLGIVIAKGRGNETITDFNGAADHGIVATSADDQGNDFALGSKGDDTHFIFIDKVNTDTATKDGHNSASELLLLKQVGTDMLLSLPNDAASDIGMLHELNSVNELTATGSDDGSYITAGSAEDYLTLTSDSEANHFILLIG
jgi:hypothetical protein